MEILEYVDIENIDYLKEIYSSNTNIQLGIINLANIGNIINENKELFLNIKDNIRSLYISGKSCYFEEAVKIISSIEDILGIEIKHVVLESEDIREMIELIEFYKGDIFFAIVANKFDIINIISFIERNKLNNVNIGISNITNNIWTQNSYLFGAICEYVGIMYNNYNITLTNMDKYDKLKLDFYIV